MMVSGQFSGQADKLPASQSSILSGTFPAATTSWTPREFTWSLLGKTVTLRTSCLCAVLIMSTGTTVQRLQVARCTPDTLYWRTSKGNEIVWRVPHSYGSSCPTLSFECRHKNAVNPRPKPEPEAKIIAPVPDPKAVVWDIRYRRCYSCTLTVAVVSAACGL